MISADVVYTKEHFRKLLSMNKKNNFRMIYSAACLLLGLIFGFLFIKVDSSETAYLTLSIITLVCGGITLRWTFMMLPGNQLKKHQSIYPDGKWSFSFDEDKIVCNSKSAVHTRRSEYSYASVESAVFKDDLFVLRLCGNAAWIMFFAEDIKEGNPDALKELLSRRLGEKFTEMQ